MEIIDDLISQLGVSNDQAEGGAGLLLKMAKEKLGAGDFEQVSNLIPGLDDLLGKAPDVEPVATPEAAESDGGGILGAIGGVADAIGMGDIADKLGDLAGAADGFKKLGLDVSMVSKFATAIIAFLQSKGGEQVATILKSVLK